MRKQLFLITMLLTSMVFAQNTYLSVGLSSSSGDDMLNTTYPSLEIGKTFNTTSIGLNVGKKDLKFNDIIKDYYAEISTSKIIIIDQFKGIVCLAVGNYISTKYTFIEYGVGWVYSIQNKDFVFKYSNFDKVSYVNVTYVYNLL